MHACRLSPHALPTGPAHWSWQWVGDFCKLGRREAAAGHALPCWRPGTASTRRSGALQVMIEGYGLDLDMRSCITAVVAFIRTAAKYERHAGSCSCQETAGLQCLADPPACCPEHWKTTSNMEYAAYPVSQLQLTSLTIMSKRGPRSGDSLSGSAPAVPFTPLAYMTGKSHWSSAAPSSTMRSNVASSTKSGLHPTQP